MHRSIWKDENFHQCSNIGVYQGTWYEYKHAKTET